MVRKRAVEEDTPAAGSLPDPEDFHATPATTENASPMLIMARPTSEHSPNISSLSVYNNLG